MTAARSGKKHFRQAEEILPAFINRIVLTVIMHDGGRKGEVLVPRNELNLGVTLNPFEPTAKPWAPAKACSDRCEGRHHPARPLTYDHRPWPNVFWRPASRTMCACKLKKRLTRFHLLCSCRSRSMRTCTYTSTVISPTMSVAKAARHSRSSQGCVSGPGLSRSHKWQTPEANLDNPEVSR